MTIHSISSGDADVSRTHISVFTLPTRTFTGGLRFTWLDYVGEEARRKAASIHSPSASVSYLATEALMRALAAPRLGISGRSARTITVDRSCRLCTSGKPHGKPRIAGVNFNMSQVPSLAAGGFCTQQQVVLGIDLEAVQASLFRVLHGLRSPSTNVPPMSPCRRVSSRRRELPSGLRRRRYSRQPGTD